MNLLRTRFFRLPVIAVGAAAWLAVSNHCAIAAVEGAVKAPTPSCHGAPAEHAPSKHDRESGVECCKVLRATLPTGSNDLALGDGRAFAWHDYVVAVFPAVNDAQVARVIEWDTGPPGVRSFVESVLQRSLLAHAPPPLA